MLSSVLITLLTHTVKVEQVDKFLIYENFARMVSYKGFSHDKTNADDGAI